MIEKAVAFGPERALVGVWSEPEGGAADDGRPTVILPNGGIVHHVGTFRLHVRTARALAARGFTSLRFDYRGIGDSSAPREAASLEDLVLQDIDAAVTHVREAYGRERVVFLGYCSGAYDALLGADRHEGVVGVIGLDLNADFDTWRFRVRQFAARLVRWRGWGNTLKLRLRRMAESVRGAWPPVDRPDEESRRIGVRRVLPREELRQRLRPLLDRRVAFLFVFSGGMTHFYNAASQFSEALPDIAADPNVSSLFLPKTDHSFSTRAHQESLLAPVVTWLEDRFERREGDSV